MVTCRTFETPAAGTIPLFILDPEYVDAIYGKDARQLVLRDDDPQEQIVDLVSNPQRYADIVQDIRRDFSARHSPEARLRQLIEIIEE